MKAKRWVSYITFCLVCLSLLAVTCYYKYKTGIVFSLSLAIFGSAFLGFCITFTEYFSEKKKCLETLYAESIAFRNVFLYVKYFNVAEPIDKIIAYFSEEYSNVVSEILGQKAQDSAKINLAKSLISNIPRKSDKNHLLEDFINHKKLEYTKKMNDSIDSIIMLSEFDIGSISNAFGSLGFLINNKNRLTKIENDFYGKICSYVEEAKLFARHSAMYRDGSSKNTSAILTMMLELLDRWFEIKYVKQEVGIFKSISFNAFLDIDNAIEEFRCRIYGQKFIEEKYPPTTSILIGRSK